MLQFDANANAQANIDASVNGPLVMSLDRHIWTEICAHSNH